MKAYRIFLVLGGKATSGDTNNIWVRNLYDPLTNLGHDVYLLNIDEDLEGPEYYQIADRKERLSTALPEIFFREHNKRPFDIFFSYLHSRQVNPQVLSQIRNHVYTINYSTNYHQFEIYKEVAKQVDYNIYISKIARSGFDELGVKSYWMPLAANPAFYKPSEKKNARAVFVGSAYGPRANLFWRLLQYGADLHLYGYGWQPIETREEVMPHSSGIKKLIKSIIKGKPESQPSKVNDPEPKEVLQQQYDALNETILTLMRNEFPRHIHGSLPDSEYVQTLAEAEIVINIQESRFNHDFYNHRVLFGSNLRDYETTLCGTLLCTQYSDEISELFDIGKEIICYHNEHDLAEKLKYFHLHDRERLAIANAGYQRSLATHTWEKRLSDFFQHLQL